MAERGKPLDPKVKARYAYLVGIGATGLEASLAVGISTASGERIMSDPEYRKIADEARVGRGLGGQVAQVVADGLMAVHADGTPDYKARAEAAAIFIRKPEAFASDVDTETMLPDGVVEVYPVPPSVQHAVEEAERAEADPHAAWQDRFLSIMRLGGNNGRPRTD